MPIYLNNKSYDIAFGVKPIEKLGDTENAKIFTKIELPK
jgi:hypothetical protein